MKEFEKRLISSIILILITLLVVLEGKTFFYIFLFIAFLISSYEWLKMIKRGDIKILGILFLSFSFYSAFFFRNQNLEGFLLIILICISTDMGGYIFGNLFKGPKLSKISPNKTQSGMIGGFVVSLITSSIFVLQYSNDIYIDQNLIENDLKFVILILLISSVSQIGDLIISYFKRSSKIKNTGNIIPGHGGLLDRIDGMIFVFPFVYLITIISIIIKL
ncbi:phosphatidate cytidylyltransferase [Candidatus Pelagibacter sp.]|uniref:phosphatidate cytidylyltransferase n=1 Tax=Candidatus Pelagibacter sp. TaxID=2024849 RepID=UPI003F82C35D